MNTGVYVIDGTSEENHSHLRIISELNCEESYKHGDVVLVLGRSTRRGMNNDVIDVVHVLYKGKKTLIINKFNWQFFEEIT